MKIVLTCIILILSPLQVIARDSSWFLCKGPFELYGENRVLVLNFFEHRVGASTRATDFTMIFGGFTLRGTVDTTNLHEHSIMEVSLEDKQHPSTFSGKANISFNEMKVSLDGKITFNNSPKEKVRATLDCEEMR